LHLEDFRQGRGSARCGGPACRVRAWPRKFPGAAGPAEVHASGRERLRIATLPHYCGGYPFQFFSFSALRLTVPLEQADGSANTSFLIELLIARCRQSTQPPVKIAQSKRSRTTCWY